MLICPYNSFTEKNFIEFSSEETLLLTEEQEFASCEGGETKKKCFEMRAYRAQEEPLHWRQVVHHPYFC